MAQYEIDLAAWVKRVKEGNGDRVQQTNSTEKPDMERIYTTDATIEALCGYSGRQS